MPREKLQSFTESMYYVMLSLTKPLCGIEIMQRVRDLSGGQVIIGPGTLYTMLSKFEENGLIAPAEFNPGSITWTNRKNYVITVKGKQMLRQEYERLKRQISDGEKIMEGLK